MRPRALLLLALIALSGTAAAVPSLAAAAEAKLEVNENCVEPDWPCWATPGSSQPAARVTIAAGGSITFVDMGTAANLAWTGTAPTCEPAVPVAPAPPAGGWEGRCTFTAPGTYRFESSTLWFEYTRYEVVVGGTPKAETTPAGLESQTEAMLKGNVQPEGNATEYHFDYGSASLTEHSTPSTGLPADFTSHPVSLSVNGLLPDTEYRFELIVSYGGGQTVSGDPVSFTTPPAAGPMASTLAASGIKETEVTLNGKVDPEGGAESEYFFEWGAGSGESYEHVTTAASLPSDGAQHQVSAVVTGLTPGSGYHFRIVAKNGLGSVEGDDLTFTAASTPPPEEPTQPTEEPPAPEPPAREPPPAPASTGANPATATAGPRPAGQPVTAPTSGPLLRSIRLASTHGGRVRGSLIVSSAGSTGRLQIELLAKGVTAPVGRLVRSSLRPGKVTFALRLRGKGKAALRRHRHLALTVKITLTPRRGRAVTVTRRVIARA